MLLQRRGGRGPAFRLKAAMKDRSAVICGSEYNRWRRVTADPGFVRGLRDFSDSADSERRSAVGRLAPNASGYTYAKFMVVDGGPTGDAYGAAGHRSAIAPPCTPITTSEGDISVLPEPLLTGEIQVIDALPLPTATEQCKNGGLKTFGVFKNQGDCVSFVATGGKNPPGGS
jgi:hypothetical protein